MRSSEKSSSQKSYLKRVVDVEFLTHVQIRDVISSGRSFQTEDVVVSGQRVPFYPLFPSDLDLDQKTWSIPDEVRLATAIRRALVGVRDVDPGLLNDHGIWTWIAVDCLRSYVVNRWCGGYDSDGRPRNADGCSYFLTGDGVHAQSRCAPRRLYIAAETSFRADGNDLAIGKFLQKADIFSSIFERKLGLDPELAVEMLNAFHDMNATRLTYRKASKLIGLMLSTTCLEALDRMAKAELVAEAMAEVATPLIDE